VTSSYPISGYTLTENVSAAIANRASALIILVHRILGYSHGRCQFNGLKVHAFLLARLVCPAILNRWFYAPELVTINKTLGI